MAKPQIRTDIENINVQLAEKASQVSLDNGLVLKRDKVIKLNAELDFDDTTKAQMTGVTPITYSAIPSVNSLKGEQIKGYKVGKNLFNKATATLGKFIDGSGNIVTSPDYALTDFMPVSNNTNLVRNRANGFQSAYFDSARNLVVVNNSQPLAFTTPSNSNIAFIRQTIPIGNVNTYQLELGTVSTSYEAYKITLDFDNTGIDFIPSKITITNTEGKNLIVNNELLEIKHSKILNKLVGVKNGTFNFDVYLCTSVYVDNDGTTPFSASKIPKIIRTTNIAGSAQHYAGINGASIVAGTTPKWGCWYRKSDLLAIVPNTVYLNNLCFFNGSGLTIEGATMSIVEMTTLGSKKSTKTGLSTITSEVKAIYGDWVFIQTSIDIIPSGTTSTTLYLKFYGTQATAQKIDRVGLTCILSDDDILPQLVYNETVIAEQAITRYSGKKAYTFGDSLTDGATSNWVAYATGIIGCNTTNRGSSGANSGRLVSEVTYIKNRDANPISGTPDYSDCAFATIMIGTNEGATGSMSSFPQVSNKTVLDLPFVVNSVTITTEDEYWSLFENNFYGNVALCIEYIRSKNIRTKIFLITPPTITAVKTAMLEIANYYKIPVIDAQTNAGLDSKHNHFLTVDGIHFNTTGGELFGDYVAYQILSN